MGGEEEGVRTMANGGWIDTPRYSICEGYSSHLVTIPLHLYEHLYGNLTGDLIDCLTMNVTVSVLETCLDKRRQVNNE